MAAIVYFSKVSEDSSSVRYAFGGDPSEVIGILVMDKETRRVQVGEEDISYLMLKASRKINSMYDERNEWPTRGMSVS